MITLPVELGASSYEIEIGAGRLAHLGATVAALGHFSRIAVLSDETVAARYADAALASLRTAGIMADLITFPVGEESKSLTMLQYLTEAMLDKKLDRKSCVVALGGGVTGDLAGFAAGTYMRGIPFVQVPTTLLAMVDSSSGGKTGVNLPHGKNIVGVFHQPRRVVIDIDTLQTLPVEELRCGLAEVIKHGIIRDAAYFELVESNADKILALDLDMMTRVVHGSCRIKGAVVSADEREQGERALLNLGHTFGHAFEALSHYEMKHGDAVAVGTLAAASMAEELLGSPPDIRRRIGQLFQRFGMPTQARGYNANELLNAMYGDKKTVGGRLTFVLPEKIGSAQLINLTNTAPVLRALETILQG